MTVSAPQRQTGVRPDRRGDAMHRPPARGSKLKSLGMILLWQVAALLVVEGVLYWAGLGEQDIYKLDSEIGFKHFPDKRVTWRSEGFSQSYFDSDGMRDPGLTIAKPVGVYRVALLGDSMVEGLQVPIEQTFGKLMETKLAEDTGRKVQVLNFANSGYSTVQEYLELKDKVFKYNPDLVVLDYTSRDMFENWTQPDATLTNVRPVAVHLPGRQLIVDNSPVKTWMKTPRAKYLLQMEWLRHHSRIWGLVTDTEMQLSLQDPFFKGFMAFCTNPRKAFYGWVKDVKGFTAHPPSLAQLTAPSFKIRFFEGNADPHVAAVNRNHKRAPLSANANAIRAAVIKEQLSNEQKLALIEASFDKVSPAMKTKSNSVEEALAQSSIVKAPSAVPTVSATSAQEAAVQSSIIKAPSAVPSVTSNSQLDGVTQSSIICAPGEAPKLTFVVEPQLNKAAPRVGFAQTPKPIIRQADVEISEPQVTVSHHARKATGALAVAPSDAVPGKVSSVPDASANLDVSKAKNGNETYVRLMSRTMQSLLSEMKSACTQHNANFAVVFIPSRAQMSPAQGMETNFFDITYADEIREVSQGCTAEQIPFFNGERAAERVAPALRSDLFYLMHMNAIGHKLFARQMEPFIAQLIGKTN